MRLLKDVARYVRSKNAGPFWVTVDIFCDNSDDVNVLLEAESLKAAAIGRLYNVDAASVRIFPLRKLNALKISFPRPMIAGAFKDRDAHAGQYFVPMLNLMVG